MQIDDAIEKDKEEEKILSEEEVKQEVILDAYLEEDQEEIK